MVDVKLQVALRLPVEQGVLQQNVTCIRSVKLIAVS